MPSHFKEISVTALLQDLNQELDRSKRSKVDDLLVVPNAQTSSRCRLGPRLSHRPVQISRSHSGEELCGAIFMCNRRTWKECLGQCLFGLPIGKKNLVDQIFPGMKLFLFEYERRQLWGVFDAISHGSIDIIPDAYSGGSFPCQVRVKVPEDCVALYEEEFYEAIEDNYFSHDKFHFALSAKQVVHLISLFEMKYLRAKGLLIDYEEKHRLPEKDNSTGPLLFTREEDITSLPHNLYNPGFQIQDASYFYYQNIDKFASHIVPFANSSVQGNHIPLNLDVTGMKNVGDQLGDFRTGNLLPLYSTVTKQEIIETVVIPGHVPRLHSDRPGGKSVWTRISGRAKKTVVASENTLNQKKLPANTAHLLPPNVGAESIVANVESSYTRDVCNFEVSEEPAEDFFVGFRRRRVSSKGTTGDASETQASKRRRKLMRPCFEASADSSSTEQATPLSCDVPCNSKTGGSNGNHTLHAKDIDCQPAKLDLNLPLEDGELESNQGLDLLTQMSSVCTSLESMGAEITRVNTLSLAPCTPAKDVVGNSYSAVTILDEGHTAVANNEVAQEIPLKLESGNGASLADVNAQMNSNVILDRAKAESGSEAISHDTFDGMSSKQSGTVSLDSISGSTLLNSVDLKSILNGVQISGIRLQLGASPCLILQLGDSSSSANSQDQEGATQICTEANSKGLPDGV